MSKETAKKAKGVKKNPLLDDEDTAKAEDTADTDEGADEATEKVPAEEVETPKAEKKATAVAPKADIGISLNSDIARTKAKIEAEPKMAFMIPLAQGEKVGSFHECFINGYKYTVKKGEMVQIPQSIFNLLAEHYKITSEAGANFRVDLDATKMDKLG